MTSTPPSSTVPPGWYADPTPPSAQPGLRWWDGERWTEHVAPGPPAPVGDTRATTPDGVPLAGWGQRLSAYLIDGLVLLVPILVLGFPFLRSIGHDYGVYLDRALDAANTGSTAPTQFSLYGRIYPAAIGLSAVGVVVVAVYDAIMLKTRAATVGKLAMGLRVRLRDAPGR